MMSENGTPAHGTDSGVNEKAASRLSGMVVLVINTALMLAATGLLVWGFIGFGDDIPPVILVLTLVYICLIGPFLYKGLKVLKPNEAHVLVLFGNYYGTLNGPGFFFVNPLVKSGGAISLKMQTLDNKEQKINDLQGNPIIIGIVVIWRVVNTAKAAFSVDNYEEFLSIQSDAALRNTVNRYPYDVPGEADGEKSLRGSSQEIAAQLRNELQTKVDVAGLRIEEARITQLAYAPEIAAAMLQRQQAAAVIDARQIIVDGAVGMVEMALAKLSDKNIIQLDEERKAAMVSNLLVVLCSNKDTQPVVNSGSIY
ncbi:MAG: SPFH domain-containing protein [Treponema sp.]|nr:SPFH domain-containing protein [Treponema sp.]